MFPVVFHIMEAPLPPDCATLNGSDAAGSESSAVGCGWGCWIALELNL